ncbi:MAG: hypothetical protein LUD72_08560, partial [Bacteroidales bacterium]|nr:hypothetical protein [Bacteroidales bacterium]
SGLDIYGFFNSKDIAEHLKGLHYEFSLPEAAFIVYQSEHRTLEEKCAAWRELIDTMPDCSVEGDIDRMPIESFHQFLRDYMALQKKLLQTFCDAEGFLYTYEVYAAGRHANTMSRTEFGDQDAHWDAVEKYFANPKAAFADFKREKEEYMEEGVQGVRFIKKPLLQEADPDRSDEMYVEMTTDLEAIAIDVYGFGTLSKEETDLANQFDWMWFAFPTPFKRGDILTDGNRPFILDHLLSWDADTFLQNGFPEQSPMVKGVDERVKRLRESGDTSDMDYDAVYLDMDKTGFPVIARETFWTYLNLERYEGPLRGMYRMLKPISGAMTQDPERGEPSVDTTLLCDAYQLILMEQLGKWNRSWLEMWYSEEGLELAGLKDRT